MTPTTFQTCFERDEKVEFVHTDSEYERKAISSTD